MSPSFSELLPFSGTVNELTDLQGKAIFAIKRLREHRKNEFGLQPLNFIKDTCRSLFNEVIESGKIRAIRIVRLETTEISGVDASATLSMEAAVLFATQVATNIDRELREIDQRRMLCIGLLSTIAAAVAAGFAAVTVVFQWWKS